MRICLFSKTTVTQYLDDIQSASHCALMSFIPAFNSTSMPHFCYL